MIELMRFIFSSFWVFCGTVILIYTVSASISMIIGTIISTVRGDDVKISVGSGNMFSSKPKEKQGD